MQTKEDVEAQFRKELSDLLKKWNADVVVADHYRGYSECGQELRTEVDIPAIYNKNNETVREYTNFDLGCYLD